MRSVSLVVLLMVLTSCGTDVDSTESVEAGPATDTSKVDVPSADVAATAPGLAAAVLRHLEDEAEVRRMRGGLLDMEDQRTLTVDLTLDEGAGFMSVSAHDPDYLAGDQGPDECRKEGVQRTRWGTSRCHILDDGTIVETIETTYGFSDNNRHGSAAMAMSYGPRGYVQVMFETYERRSAVDVGVLDDIVSDPSVGWYTTPEMNAEGEQLEGFVTRDRVE